MSDITPNQRHHRQHHSTEGSGGDRDQEADSHRHHHHHHHSRKEESNNAPQQQQQPQKHDDNNNDNNDNNNDPSDTASSKSGSSSSSSSSSRGGCCSTCCGACPEGCTTWLRKLDKISLAFFFLMFVVCIVLFAGSGATLFEKTDETELWSVWFHCVKSSISGNVTSSTSSSTTLIGVTVGTNYKCTATYDQTGIWPCTEVENRMFYIGGLHVTGFLFALFTLLLLIGHLLKKWKAPVIEIIFCLVTMTTTIAAASLTRDLWTGTLCPEMTTSNETASYYPRFNQSLSSDSTLTFGDGYGAVVSAALFSAIALFVGMFICLCPDGLYRRQGIDDDEGDDENMVNGDDENQEETANEGGSEGRNGAEEPLED